MLVFNHAQTLSYSTQLNYVGDSFNYNNTSNLSIKGRLQSDKNYDTSQSAHFGMAYVENSGLWFPLGGGSGYASGAATPFSGNLMFEGGYVFVSIQDTGNVFSSGQNPIYSPLYDIWDGMDEIRSSFNDFQEIIINGTSIGSGRITRFLFPESRDARVSNYEVDIEVYKTGNLFNLSGQGFNNIVIDQDFCRYVSDLDESFSFETNPDGSLSYERSFNFNCVNPNLQELNLVQKVQNFASGFIYNDPSFEASFKQYPHFYEMEGSRYFSESYDNIQGSYGFSERFEGGTTGENYRWNHSMSLSLQGEGESTVSEQGSVIGIRKNILDSAYLGMERAETSAYGRATGFYAAYVGGSGICGSGIFLKSSSKTINTEMGIIEYDFQYGNDPFSNGCFAVQRDIEFSKDEMGLFSITEQGSVRNTCAPTNFDKLNQSVNYFNTNISGGIPARVYAIYTGNASGCGCSGGVSTGDLRQISTEKTYSEFDGLFSYSFLYKNECNSLTAGCYYITSEKEISDSIHNVYLAVTPYSGEIAQKQNTSSIVSETQTVLVKSTCLGKTINDYLNAAISGVQTPSASTYYMNSANYSFDPDDSRLSLSVEYNYTGYRAFPNINV